MKDSGVTRGLKLAGIGLILIVGLIHLFETPEYYATATYLGVLFVLNAVGSVAAALGISRDVRSWGWTLGALIAGGAFIMYVVSRTAGLPGLAEAEFFEPSGIASLVVEALYLAVFLKALTARPASAEDSAG